MCVYCVVDGIANEFCIKESFADNLSISPMTVGLFFSSTDTRFLHFVVWCWKYPIKMQFNANPFRVQVLLDAFTWHGHCTDNLQSVSLICKVKEGYMDAIKTYLYKRVFYFAFFWTICHPLLFHLLQSFGTKINCVFCCRRTVILIINLPNMEVPPLHPFIDLILSNKELSD